VCRYLLLPSITRRQLRFLDCTRLSDGHSYLRLDTSVDCGTDEYKRLVLYDVGFILLYQAIPIYWLWLLVRAKPRIQEYRNILAYRDQHTRLEELNQNTEPYFNELPQLARPVTKRVLTDDVSLRSESKDRSRPTKASAGFRRRLAAMLAAAHRLQRQRRRHYIPCIL
jgi:hypothetical protein